MKRRIGTALQGISSVARSGFALIVGSLIGSALGVVFWALAARLLSPEQLGIGAALVSAISTLSHASQLNLRNLLHRFVPSAGAVAPVIIHRTYAVAAIVAVLLGTGFVVLVVPIAPELAVLGQSPVATAGFVIGLLIWTLYALQEAALTALRLAAYVPIQSLAYSVAKIACLVTLAMGMAIATAVSILVSWIVPALMIGVITHIWVSRRQSTRPPTLPAETVGWRQVASFFGWDYVGALATSVSLGVAPILVVSLSGAADVAPYYLAWSITYMLYLVSRHVGAAMLAELATGHRRALYADAILFTVLPVSCGVAVMLLFAPQIMLIFGPSYVATGSATLRILAVAALPGSVVTAYLAICRAEGWVRTIALLQVVILVTLFAVGGPLTASVGQSGMAWGWLIANSLAALLALGVAFSRAGVFGALDFAAEVTSAASRVMGQLRSVLPTEKKSLKGKTIDVGGQTWTVTDSSASPEEVTTLKLRAVDDQNTAVVLKRASTPHAKALLRQEHAALLSLRQDARMLSVLADLLPQPIHCEDGMLLLSSLPGSEARAAADLQAELMPVFAATVETLASLHRLSGVSQTPIAGWITNWIDDPLARIGSMIDLPPAIALVAEELHRWAGSEHRFGPAHGDLRLENLRIERDASIGVLRLSGLINWGSFRPDAPAGLDACTLAMAVRATSSGRQLGQVVLDLLRQPAWTSAELAWLTRAGQEAWLVDADALRGMVLLTWLQHINTRLGKAQHYSATSSWGLINVRLVLDGLSRMPR